MALEIIMCGFDGWIDDRLSVLGMPTLPKPSWTRLPAVTASPCATAKA